MSTIADRIRVRRIELGLNAAELARRVQISRAYMSEIERGKKGPSPAVLMRIAQALDVTPGDLADRLDVSRCWHSALQWRRDQVERVVECVHCGAIFYVQRTELAP